MKKFKNLMLMLALALFFVGAMGMTKASAEGENVKTITVENMSVDYDEEVVVVTYDKPVYYQILKKEADIAKMKADKWLPAAKAVEAETTKYYIDFSATSNTADSIVVVTDDRSKADVQAKKTIDAAIKSVKITLDYTVEDIYEGVAQVIAKAVVKASDDEDFNDPDGTGKYQYIWKRGANGNWKDGSLFTNKDWNMMKSSNGTLYVSIKAKDTSETEEANLVVFRRSKEAKVKIPKTAKAPTVKVDYVKGTIALKNGMQIARADAGPDVRTWFTIPAFDKDGNIETKFELGLDLSKKTTAKVSSITIDELKEEFQEAGTESDGKTMEFAVRTAATDKKFPSAETALTLVLPAGAIGVTDTSESAVEFEMVDAKKAEIDFKKLIKDTTDEGKVDADNKISAKEYEFMLVASSKLTEGKAIDFANSKQKWIPVPEDGIYKISDVNKEFAFYTKAGDTIKNEEPVYLTDLDTIYIRKAAVKTTKDSSGATVEGTFASKYAEVKVAIVKTYKLTFEAEGDVTDVKIGETGATLTDGVLKVRKGDVVTFKYTKADEKATVEVSDGAKKLEAAEGVYTVTVAEADITITITETPAESDQGSES